MKFVDTYRFSPVRTMGDVPWEDDYFHMRSEEIDDKFIKSGNYEIDENWWKIQYDRCINGYTIPNAIIKGGDAIVDGVDAIWYDKDVYLPDFDLWIRDGNVKITGRHYWYMNFWPIYGLDSKINIKRLIYPKFIDMDFLFFRRVEMMFEQQKDDAEPKARQKGFSEKGASLMGYNYTFIQDSVNIIVGGTSDDAEHTMDNTKRGLELIRNTQFYKDRIGKNYGVDKTDVWKTKKFGSEIRCITAKDNLQALNRFSPFMVWYEEVGKWKQGSVLGTKSFVEPATRSEGKKTGYSFYVGTGGDMEGGADDLEQLSYNPEQHNCLAFQNKFENPNMMAAGKSVYFTGDWWYTIIDKDGNSLKAESLEHIKKEEEKKSNKDRYIHKTQHPIWLADCFYSSSEGYFGKDIIEMLYSRRSFIKTHREAQIGRYGRLEWTNKQRPLEGCRFIDDEDGWLYLIEEPMKDSNGSPVLNLYEIGTDSYDQDEAEYSTSKGACFVKKRFYSPSTTSNKFVARTVQRPTTAEGGSELFYERTAMMCVYFNLTQNLIEYSKIRIFDWYEYAGLSSLLRPRPGFVIANMINNSTTNNKYGIDPSSKPHWLAYLKDWLTPENINNMDDIDQITAFAKFKYIPGGDPRKYNCDITIASALAVVSDRDDMGVVARSVNELQQINRQRVSAFVPDGNGGIRRIYQS